MAAHRYWRLLCRASGAGQTVVGLGELHMRASLGGENVATGGTASASSTFNAAYTADKAFDGLTTDTGAGNAWATAAEPNVGGAGLGSFGWLQYDFGDGNEQDIAEIVIHCPASGGISLNNMVTAWMLQWSDDAASWTTQRHYSFDPDTPAWTYLTSRTYDVRPLGAIDIHNQAVGQIFKRISPALGQPSAPVYDPNSPAGKITLDHLRYAHSNVFGGECRLAGSTTSLGFPAPRRVRLYDQRTGRLHAEANTGQDGAFEFRNIHPGPWSVVGIDDTGAQNGVIYTHVTAVPM